MSFGFRGFEGRVLGLVTFPRGSMCSTIMEQAPQNHTQWGFWVPNSIKGTPQKGQMGATQLPGRAITVNR